MESSSSVLETNSRYALNHPHRHPRPASSEADPHPQLAANAVLFLCGNVAGAYHKALMERALRATFREALSSLHSRRRLDTEKKHQVRWAWEAGPDCGVKRGYLYHSAGPLWKPNDFQQVTYPSLSSFVKCGYRPPGKVVLSLKQTEAYESTFMIVNKELLILALVLGVQSPKVISAGWDVGAPALCDGKDLGGVLWGTPSGTGEVLGS